MFASVYNGKRVLVTGHTGFKGSWLSAWLLKLGAEVTGVSHDIPTQPAMFEELELEHRIKHIQADIRDLAAMKRIVMSERPDFVFHLAAQAIVSASYDDPINTVTTNVVGTMNILDVLRSVDWPCVAVFITSDKCYDNVEWVWGYRETDALGGRDIYSGSKGAAELIIKSYLHSFLSVDGSVRLAVARAGNVIGGGDWAKDRIIADTMRAWSENRIVEVRSPTATRPWQHVLEPLSGYLLLGQTVMQNRDLHGEAFNFGPRAEQNRTVAQLLEGIGQHWGLGADGYRVVDNIPFHEAGLLKLNCDKALLHLQWEANLAYSEMIQMVGDWYYHFYRDRTDMYTMTMNQITAYEDIAIERDRIWAAA